MPFFLAVESGGTSLPVLIGMAAGIGLIAALVLYKTAHVKNKLDIDVLDVQRIEVNTTKVPSDVREKIKKLPIRAEHAEETVQALSKIVEEETHNLLQEIKQEYSVKYQVVEQEKRREVDAVKRQFKEVEQKFVETQKAYEKSEIEKKTTEAVVKSIAEGVVVVNHKGEVLLMNPSAEKLLGKEKKVGQSILDGSRDDVMVSLTRDSSDGSEKVIEFRSKDENTRRILRSSSAVIQNENGQTVGMVKVLTDVTKQKELDEVKNRFVSNVTHELRTPIVAMQKAMTLLSSGAAGVVSSDQEKFLNIVSRNLGQLHRLVEDLLDMAKIESGTYRLKIVPTRLDRVAADVCDALETWSKTKDIKIARQFDKSLPEVPVDPDKITQVLNNLIGNAIKFTPNGGTITVKTAWAADSTAVLLSVSDTGVGMTPENMKKLFGRFEQFGDQQGIVGTGLGLSITKEIVERHGGKIWAESESKKGSTFTCTLPVKQRQAGG